MAIVKSIDNEKTIIPHPGRAITDDFIDAATHYRIVIEEETCARSILTVFMTTLNPQTMEIITPEDRREDLLQESVAREGEFEIRSRRERNLDTGGEYITEKLYLLETGEYLLQQRYRAYSACPAASLIDSYKRILARYAEQEAKKFAPLKTMTRDQIITFLTFDIRKARRTEGEQGGDENTCFDPKQWNEYRTYVPQIDSMIEEIFHGVFIGCWPEAEEDARARLGKIRRR